MMFSWVLPTARHGVVHPSMGCTSTQNDTADSTPGCKSTGRDAMAKKGRELQRDWRGGRAPAGVLWRRSCGRGRGDVDRGGGGRRDGLAFVVWLQGRAGARPWRLQRDRVSRTRRVRDGLPRLRRQERDDQLPQHTAVDTALEPVACAVEHGGAAPSVEGVPSDEARRRP